MDELDRVYERVEDIVGEIDDYYNQNYGDIDTTPQFRREFYNDEINNIIEDLQNETPVDIELINALRNYLSSEINRDSVSPSLSPRDGGFQVKKANKGGIIYRNNCVF